MARPPTRTLTDREIQIMEALWLKSPISVAEILDYIPGKIRPAYNTILTIVQAMERKGWVKRDARGKAHLYRPAMAKGEYKRFEIKTMLGRLFGGDSVSLAAHLIQEENLSKDELKQIQKMLKDLE